MEKVSRKQIEEVCKELEAALLAEIELDEKLQHFKSLQAKAHYRLSKARDEVRNLKVL